MEASWRASGFISTPPDPWTRIELILFERENELDRQRTLVHEESESTNPHPNQLDMHEETPSWIWEFKYGYKRTKVKDFH